MKCLERVVGRKSLDLCPRIHKFEASAEFIYQMTNHSLFPIKGLLSADDNRISYSLTSANNQILIRDGYYKLQNIVLLRTTQRYDSLKPASIVKLFKHSGGTSFYS